MPSDSVVTALIGMVGGGLGIAIVNQFFGHKGRELEDGAKIRTELWDEIHKLRNEAAIDRGHHQQCQRDLAHLTQRYDDLEGENRNLRRRVEELERRPR